ncbi:tubby C-terminal domain-like protein, partial [Bacillus pseudomycoides]
MQKYTYSPPKIKDSTKLVDVIDQHGNVVLVRKR